MRKVLTPWVREGSGVRVRAWKGNRHAYLGCTVIAQRRDRLCASGAGSDLLFHTFQTLIRKSGTYERYGRRYGKKADGSPPREPVAGELIEGCGDPGPDAYRGHFRELAPAQDQAAVSAVESALAVLRTEATIAHAGTGANVPGKFRVLREKTANAAQPLEAIGLYRLLLDTVAAAESFAGEGEYMEADELLEEFDRHLRQRMGMPPAR